MYPIYFWHLVISWAICPMPLTDDKLMTLVCRKCRMIQPHYDYCNTKFAVYRCPVNCCHFSIWIQLLQVSPRLWTLSQQNYNNDTVRHCLTLLTLDLCCDQGPGHWTLWPLDMALGGHRVRAESETGNNDLQRNEEYNTLKLNVIIH